MTSKVYSITKEQTELEEISAELEASGTAENLQKNEILRLQLLTEELLGMLPELMEYCSGEFWFEKESCCFELHALIRAMENVKPDQAKILSVSSSGKNSANEGFMGKMRQIVEMMLHGEEGQTDHTEEVPDSKWSLKGYLMELVKEEADPGDKWVELEKSIVASFSDDVEVKIVDKTVEIIVYKMFSDHERDQEFLASPLQIDIKERSEKKLSGEKHVFLKDIKLSVKPGQMVLILGGSGSGKTTFVNAVTGYEKADAVIRKGQIDIYKDYDQVKDQIAFVPQQDIMRTEDTVYNILANAAYMKMPAYTKRNLREKRISDIIEMFGLEPERNSMASKLSGGQRKRLSIGIEFMADPILFFLDEPDSGLDGIMARSLMENLHSLVGKSRQVFVISHSPDRVIDLFDQVIVLAKSQESRAGQLAFYGTPDEAKEFFGVDSMEGIVKVINRIDEGGEGRADEMIEKYKLVCKGAEES